MSDLGGLRTVPALLTLACILVGVALAAGLCAWCFSSVRIHYDDLTEKVKVVCACLATVCLVGAIASAITGGGLSQKHWNDTCHRMGGVLVGDGNCVKPHSVIDVP